MKIELPIMIAAVAVALALPAVAADGLLPDWGGDVPKFTPATPGRQYAIDLKPEWRGLRLRAEMRATDIRRGKEGWNTGRITITFHDAAGKLVGRRYPLQQEVLGTTDWKKVDHEYLVPRGAVKVHVGFCNLGASGIAEFRAPSLVPTRGWITQPCDAKAPPDCLDDGPFAPAVEAIHVSQTLAGWWRCRPSFTDEQDAFVPVAGDNWGWSKLPSVWRNEQEPFPATSILSPYFEDQEARLEKVNPGRAWYARKLKMPENVRGRRVALRFTLVNTRVRAYLDGREAGEATFPNGEIDLTHLVKPGQEQFLALDVTAWPRDAVTREYNAPDRSDLKKNIVRLKGITGDFFLDVTPVRNFIRETWTETDVARGEVLFVAKVAPGHAVRTMRANVRDARRARHVFSGPARAIDRGSKEAVLALSAAWPDAPRWDLHTPGNLHTAEIELLDEQGNVLDRSAPFTFGVRDVRVDGRRLLVNGIPVHLRALYGTLANNGLDHGSRTNALKMLGNARKAGFNFVIAGNYNMGEGTVSRLEGVLQAADELGFFVSCTPPHIKQFNARLDDPVVAERYREMTERVISLWRNHPCVIACGMNHNCTGYGGDQNPWRLDGAHFNDEATRDAVGFEPVNRRNARLAGDICRRLDPTRTYYNHESGNLDRWYTLNIYLNWAPRQERSDWLEHWSKAGVKPLFFVEWGAPHIASWSSYRGPHFIWNTPGFQTTWAAEYAAAVLGETAYEDSPQMRRLLASDDAGWATGKPRFYDTRPLAALTNLYNGVQAHFMADNWRAHRTWGITAALPWDQESFLDWTDWSPRRGMPMTEVMRRWNQDDCAYIGGWDSPTDKRRNYAVGETVDKKLVVINDARIEQRVCWRCSLFDETRQGDVVVGPGEIAFVPISFKVGDQARSGEMTAEFAFADGVKQMDHFPVRIEAGVRTANKKPIFLYDPVGRTTALFRRLGIAHQPIDLTVRPEWGTRLVVGSGALTRGLLDDRVLPLVRGGSRVLIFEQDKKTLESCGFRVQEYGLRRAFPRYVSSTLGMIAPELLQDWAGASTLIEPDYENTLPAVDRDCPYTTWAGLRHSRVWRCGNRNAVATVLPEKPTLGDWRALVDGGFDLQYAPLLEWHVMSGIATFCQLDVTARTCVDPVADGLVRRLVATLDAGAETGRWPLPFGAQAHYSARRRQLPFATYYNALNSAKGANGYYISSGGVVPDDFLERIGQGANALCVGLSAEEVKAVSPVPLAVVQTNGCCFSRIARIPAEFNGLSNGDWAWHGAMDFAAFAESTPESNNSLRVVRHGKGKIVFMQVAPWMIDDENRPQLRTSRRRAEYMLSRLLWNVLGTECALGQVTYADIPVDEDDPYRYIRW